MELVPGMDLFTLLQQHGPLGPQIASLGQSSGISSHMGAEDGMKIYEKCLASGVSQGIVES